MRFKETIGIDVGKSFLEVNIHCIEHSKEFKNTIQGRKALVKWVVRSTSFEKDQLLFAFEHTGLYSYPLSIELEEQGLFFVIIPGLELKRSMGISRAKNDKIDAKKIALYAFRRKDEIKPYIMPSAVLISLKRLLSLREKLVKHRSGYKASLKEYGLFLSKKETKLIISTHKKMIAFLNKQIEVINKELLLTVKGNKQIQNLYELATSVRSIGPQTAMFIIAYTNGFTAFTKWRKFASYCGIAPFPNTSGTSVRGKTKVSSLANKKIKSLLDLCAKSAIQNNPEMKIYYRRRIDEGKAKMSTINIIRNKLLSRVFAAVNRKTPYVNTIAYAA
jgi:transposase